MSPTYFLPELPLPLCLQLGPDLTHTLPTPPPIQTCRYMHPALPPLPRCPCSPGHGAARPQPRAPQEYPFSAPWPGRRFPPPLSHRTGLWRAQHSADPRGRLKSGTAARPRSPPGRPGPGAAVAGPGTSLEQVLRGVEGGREGSIYCSSRASPSGYPPVGGQGCKPLPAAGVRCRRGPGPADRSPPLPPRSPG